MQLNYLYFIEDSYFEKYKNDTVSQNQKEDDEHHRPCYYAFKEDDIYWMIPISSRIDKYESIYNKAMQKYGMCDALAFVYVKGNKNVALLQNMIPVTEQYIKDIYTHADSGKPIEINLNKRKEINAKARKILRFARQGKKLTFTPILDFERRLKEELRNDNNKDTTK